MGNHDFLNELQAYEDAVRELNGEIAAMRAEIGRLKEDKQSLADALKLECDGKYKWKRAAETLAYTIEEGRKAAERNAIDPSPDRGAAKSRHSPTCQTRAFPTYKCTCGLREMPERARVGAKWRPIETAPRDGTYILAIVAENDSRQMGHLAGRVFAIRHEGRTESGYDMGWAVFPGYGGACDELFSHWMPLPPLPHQAPAHER